MRKITGVLLFLLVLIGLVIATPVNSAPHNPTLYFGSWTHYTDNDHSQGVAYIEVYDNSTGSFKLQENITNSESGCGVNASCSVQLIVGYVANRTHLGWDVSDNSLGRNFIKFNVSVAHSNGTTIFAQQNGTYLSNRYIGNGLFVFEHSVILNFETEYTIRYTVTMHYESYYGGGVIKKYVYYNDMSNITWVNSDDGCDKSSDGNLFTFNKTVASTTYVKDSGWTIDLEPYFIIEVNYTALSTSGIAEVLIKNSTGGLFVDILGSTSIGYFRSAIEDLDDSQYLDQITDIYLRCKRTGGGEGNKTLQTDFLNVYYWDKAEYGYYNDMSNTSWVDNSLYCNLIDAGSDMNIEDDEVGHAWGAVNDTGLLVDLAVYPFVDIATGPGPGDSWDNWSVRLKWVNGSLYDIWDHETDLSGDRLTVNALSFCDGVNTTIDRIDIICWNMDTLGDQTAFLYLNIYDNLEWHTQEVEIVLSSELFEGMLLAGVSLLGLVMIPSGTVIGALMVKNKNINEGNWLIPLFIVLIGFALFIGGMA